MSALLSRLASRILFGLPVACALGLLPAIGRGAEQHAPAIALERLQVGPDGASAPLTRGGRAELTLDPTLQQDAERFLSLSRPLAGAAVVIHVPSGRVLVWAEYSRSGQPSRVLYQASAPTASVFKIVTTAALLETGKVDPANEVCIAGGMRRIDRRHLDPPRDGKIHCGPFGHALGHSRNAAYAQLVTRHLSRDDLSNMASRFGFNQPVPFDHPVPFGSLKVPYNDLDFARAAAGFEGSTLSPLGAAYLAYVVANGGEAASVHIVERAGDYQRPDRHRTLGRVMRSWSARQLTRMMEVTVHGGTSYEAFTDAEGRKRLGEIRVAGKTGTLQPSVDAPITSWFVGFAPSRKPEIAVSVMLSNANVWRSKANEIARDIMKSYLDARRAARSSRPPSAAVCERLPCERVRNDHVGRPAPVH